jgi:ATP-dependent DNA ligase
MLLTSGHVRDGAGWTLEVKWDGCRAQLRYDGHSVSLRTRNGRECSQEFPELAAIADVLGRRRVTLDGELVYLRDDGRPDFAPLRRRLAGSARHARPVVLHVFDVLHLDGRSTRQLPYRDRRTLLDELALDGPAWRTPASIVVQRSEDFVARVESSASRASSPSASTRRTSRGDAAARGSSTSFAATNASPSPGSGARERAERRRCSSPASSRTARRGAPGRSSSGSDGR